MTKITWHGHNTWQIDTGKHTLIVDPFFDDNPAAKVKAADVSADFILVSHGHFDHVSDAASIAVRTGATVLAPFEVANWLKKQGVAESKAVGMNPGGGAALSKDGKPFGRLKMTVAHHSSSLPDGSYGGVACGLLVDLPGGRVYFACDTALFLDMRLIGAVGIDLAVLPIGDLFTMGPEDAVEAVRMLGPKRVAPCHYNTWPPIEQDAAAWAQQVRLHTSAEPLTPEVGEPFEL
ncbi:metal-dependent hydrolase [Pirellulimonas nuda]|uniref:UPF0173 metal-dependent hydrolase Pla175_09420 n=1 Tax=Pirellulimonas nuda TaxID=2528009 RepID=A0A518D7W8_9BACT|nr:metal-dependent hydrolase [Pirellulimonas nuda]QDU87577.1 metal-dependent hydrolase [Pirellulimonas nuda]